MHWRITIHALRHAVRGAVWTGAGIVKAVAGVAALKSKGAGPPPVATGAGVDAGLAVASSAPPGRRS